MSQTSLNYLNVIPVIQEASIVVKVLWKHSTINCTVTQ